MAKKKISVLLTTLATILVCLVLILAGTYALFSDKVSVKTHLQAGTLKAKLERVGLETHSLAVGSGELKDDFDDRVVDFTKETEENVFGITDETLIVPTSKFTATMALTNIGNLDFGYWIEITVDTDEEHSENFEEFAKQIELVVTIEDGEPFTQSLFEGLFIGSQAKPFALRAEGSVEFTVSVEFKDSTDNNGAKNAKVAFDLIVHATQIV